MRRAVVILLALAAVGDARAAAPESVSLPSPLAPLAPQPPLVLAPPTMVEADAVLVQPRVRSTQRVLVDVDGDGGVQRVVDVHRLHLSTSGDYSIAIGAAIVSVEAAPGSATEPGQRRDAVIWQGFSPGRRDVGARIVLRTSAAAPLLPVAIRVERAGGSTIVRLVNRTEVRASTVKGAVEPADAERVLAALRRGDVPRTRPLVRARGTLTPASVDVSAPLAVSGSLRAGRRAVAVRTLLGPQPLTVRVPGTGDLRVRLTVRPALPRVPPTTGLDARGLLDVTTRALLEAARSRQYQAFLQTPPLDTGPRTVYLYRTGAPQATAAPASPADDGRNTGVLVGAIAAAVLAAGALVVLWAHL